MISSHKWVLTLVELQLAIFLFLSKEFSRKVSTIDPLSKTVLNLQLVINV